MGRILRTLSKIRGFEVHLAGLEVYSNPASEVRHSQRAAEHHGAILREAAALADAGQLRIRVDQQHFALPDINEAFRQVAEGWGKGKTVIQVVSA